MFAASSSSCLSFPAISYWTPDPMFEFSSDPCVDPLIGSRLSVETQDPDSRTKLLDSGFKDPPPLDRLFDGLCSSLKCFYLFSRRKDGNRRLIGPNSNNLTKIGRRVRRSSNITMPDGYLERSPVILVMFFSSWRRIRFNSILTDEIADK